MRIVYEPIPLNLYGGIMPYTGFLLDPLQFNASGLREAMAYCHLDPHLNRREQEISDDPTGDNAAILNDIRRLQDLRQKMTREFAERPDHYLRGIREVLRHSRRKWDINDVRFEEEAKANIRRMERLLRRLPEYLRVGLQQEEMTIAIVNDLKDTELSDEKIKDDDEVGGIADYDRRLVAMEPIYLQDVNLEVGTDTLKEEAWHYFDMKMRFSKRDDYRAAADRLLVDEDKMASIEDMARKLRQPLWDYDNETRLSDKVDISEYGELRQRRRELLVDYLFIRDKLRKKRPQDSSAEMKKIFGDDFCRLCEEFDRSLQRQFSSFPTRPRSRTGAPEARR